MQNTLIHFNPKDAELQRIHKLSIRFYNVPSSLATTVLPMVYLGCFTLPNATVLSSKLVFTHCTVGGNYCFIVLVLCFVVRKAKNAEISLLPFPQTPLPLIYDSNSFTKQKEDFILFAIKNLQYYIYIYGWRPHVSFYLILKVSGSQTNFLHHWGD